MRVIIQRVKYASVEINKVTKSYINQGLLVFAGFEDLDNTEDMDWLAGKISRIRIFNDSNRIMNLSVNEIKGDILVISQFTLFASIKKGNRPSYVKASKPEIAISLYNKFIQLLSSKITGNVCTGVFGTDMKISLLNDGPVTIMIDTKNKE